MNQVAKDIDNYLSSRNQTYTDLAENIGVAKSTVANWINREQDLSVYSFAKIAHIVYAGNREKQEQQIIEHLYTYKDRLAVNIKVAFALGHLNDYKNLMSTLHEICESSSDLEMQRYANIFKLYTDRLDGKNVREVYLNIESTRVKNNNKKNSEIEIFCDILSMLILCDLGEFVLMEGYKNRIEENIQFVTNPYLKNLYTFWIKELWSYSLLRKEKVVEFVDQNAILRDNKDLSFFPVMEALLNIRSGESFMFSSYEKSLMYFQKALSLLAGVAEDSLKYSIAFNNINFIRIVWWKDIDLIDFTKLHPAEYALYLIKTNEKQKAIIELEKIKKKEDGWTALQTCYAGMAMDDISLIQESINMFKANNDFLYSKFSECMYNEYITKYGVQFEGGRT